MLCLLIISSRDGGCAKQKRVWNGRFACDTHSRLRNRVLSVNAKFKRGHRWRTKISTRLLPFAVRARLTKPNRSGWFSRYLSLSRTKRFPRKVFAVFWFRYFHSNVRVSLNRRVYRYILFCLQHFIRVIRTRIFELIIPRSNEARTRWNVAIPSIHSTIPIVSSNVPTLWNSNFKCKNLQVLTILFSNSIRRKNLQNENITER